MKCLVSRKMMFVWNRCRNYWKPTYDHRQKLLKIFKSNRKIKRKPMLNVPKLRKKWSKNKWYRSQKNVYSIQPNIFDLRFFFFRFFYCKFTFDKYISIDMMKWICDRIRIGEQAMCSFYLEIEIFLSVLIKTINKASCIYI